jgi:hypothetical protein
VCLLRLEEAKKKMVSFLVPANISFLTSEDLILLGRGRSLNIMEIVRFVGHLSSPVIFAQLNRFVNLCNECQRCNTDITDANAVIILLLSVLLIRCGGVTIVSSDYRIIN